MEHLEQGLNQVRKHYFEETQKTMTFKYSNKKWMDVEVDEATFDKHLAPLEDAKGQASDTGMKWEQWVGLVSRGKPESLVLVRLKPQITKRRAPGPGAIRKAEWKPIANRWLQDTCVILHSDSARSYKSKISGVLQEGENRWQMGLEAPKVCDHEDTQVAEWPEDQDEGRDAGD